MICYRHADAQRLPHWLILANDVEGVLPIARLAQNERPELLITRCDARVRNGDPRRSRSGGSPVRLG
jgi:hypothetical protein